MSDDDWLPHLRGDLPEGVTDARTLLAWLALNGMPLGAFRALPAYPAQLRRHPWLAEVRSG